MTTTTHTGLTYDIEVTTSELTAGEAAAAIKEIIEPLVFETRVFVNGEDQGELAQFYESWVKAHAGHKGMVANHQV